MLRAMNDIGLETFFGISHTESGMVIGFDECCVSEVTEMPREGSTEFFIYGSTIEENTNPETEQNGVFEL
jgi:hypothetical protein